MIIHVYIALQMLLSSADSTEKEQVIAVNVDLDYSECRFKS